MRVSYSEHPPLPRPGAAPTTFYYIIPTLPQAGEGFLRGNQVFTIWSSILFIVLVPSRSGTGRTAIFTCIQRVCPHARTHDPSLTTAALGLLGARGARPSRIVPPPTRPRPGGGLRPTLGAGRRRGAGPRARSDFFRSSASAARMCVGCSPSTPSRSAARP